MTNKYKTFLDAAIRNADKDEDIKKTLKRAERSARKKFKKMKKAGALR